MKRLPPLPIYNNLFGEQVTVPHKPKKAYDEPAHVNPMLKAYGPGPEDKRCKHCHFFIVKQWGNKYFKCEFRGNTNGPGTDHRANWPTCGKFQEEVVKK